ncbi:MAG: NADP-dependent oxidoreductase [Burkholderiales bacterium]
MRALRIHGYGGPEVMRLDEVPPPVPCGNEVLVRIHAASVNPIDWKMRQGLMQSGLPRILGRDGAGTCDGRRVMGIGEHGRDGTHTEYAVFKEIFFLPDEISFEEAAALGISGLSAWIPLVENAGVSAGQRVLVHAGAGGVGSLALQIARLRGAEVWTTCSASNAPWCRALGAHGTVDYTREDFTAAGSTFDVVLDTIGGAVHRRSAEVLKPGGKLAFLSAIPTESPTRKDITVLPTNVAATPERLGSLLALVSQGELKVPVGARFPLERGAEAYELSRGGHARGKIVLTIEQ